MVISRKYNMEFAHMLPGYDGKCSRLHGHRGELTVTINGTEVAEHPTFINLRV